MIRLAGKRPMAGKAKFSHMRVSSSCLASSVRSEANVCCIQCSLVLCFQEQLEKDKCGIIS